tara:strand:- start:1320 stop:2096 length:777 start_codon:yes stop_codon:yes gene_type:complete
MISRRLTKIQKAEIVEAYRAGNNTNALAEKYGCSAITINRTVKTFLSDSEYTFLKGKRSKISSKKKELVNNDILKEKFKEKDQSVKINEDLYSPELDKVASLPLEDADDFGDESTSESQHNQKYDIDKKNKNFENNFEEIVPLISNFDFEEEKQKLDFEILDYECLPESVYMIVDKKVELDFQPISDLPEWSFLPENELKRNAILLFANQRSAKRSCSRNQRVIKIPNTSIFQLSKSYLVSKGITRLILEDSIIAIDN